MCRFSLVSLNRNGLNIYLCTKCFNCFKSWTEVPFRNYLYILHLLIRQFKCHNVQHSHNCCVYFFYFDVCTMQYSQLKILQNEDLQHVSVSPYILVSFSVSFWGQQIKSSETLCKWIQCISVGAKIGKTNGKYMCAFLYID